VDWPPIRLLATHPTPCTLAYWHAPRFTSGTPNQATGTSAFWDNLYAAGADLVLGGNSHIYERFAPQTPDRAADPAHGIREFVVGTGGKDLQPFGTIIRPNSEVRRHDTFGRAGAHPAPDGLRPALRARGGRDVHRHGQRELPLTRGYIPPGAAARSTARATS
jgi:hypothetical protein